MLAAIALGAGIINGYGYQMTIAVIAFSLFLIPVFIMLTKRMVSSTLQALMRCHPFYHLLGFVF